MKPMKTVLLTLLLLTTFSMNSYAGNGDDSSGIIHQLNMNASLESLNGINLNESFDIISIGALENFQVVGNGDDSSGIQQFNIAALNQSGTELHLDNNVAHSAFNNDVKFRVAGNGDDTAGIVLFMAENMATDNTLKARIIDVIDTGSVDQVIFEINNDHTSSTYAAPATLINTALPNTANALEQSADLDGTWVSY